MTDIVERATRAIYRAALERGDLALPEGAVRTLRAVLVALEAPDRDMVDAAVANGLHLTPGEAAAAWTAIVKNLQRRCGPLSSQDFAERRQRGRSDPHHPAEG